MELILLAVSHAVAGVFWYILGSNSGNGQSIPSPTEHMEAENDKVRRLIDEQFPTGEQASEQNKAFDLENELLKEKVSELTGRRRRD